MSITHADIDSMLLREWQNATEHSRDTESQRLSTRAIDKTLAEFKLRGFCGFIVREIEGRLHVDALTAEDIYTPEYLRHGGVL